jgi:hypothetical protein
VYEQRFTLYTLNAPNPFDFHYIGNTARPKQRPSEHVSEFMRCSVKTHHGKSKLYDPKYMAGLLALRFEFTVLESGFATAELAELRAREVALRWAELYTAEFMLSNQNRGRGPDIKARHKRTFKAPAHIELTT